MGRVEQRLQVFNIQLPKPAVPAANYVPYVVAGNLVFVAGQVTVKDGQFLYVGKVGREVDITAAQQAARLVALNIVAQLKAAIGDLDRVVRVVKIGGFVNCTPDFIELPKVMNGCSDLIVQIFGDEVGKHARTAVGCPSLPFDVAVEADAVFEISPKT